MSSTTFVNGVTLTEAAWFQDLNTVAYNYFGDGTNLNSPTKLTVTTGIFSTSVVTPLVKAASGAFSFGGNNIIEWISNGSLIPVDDNIRSFGSSGSRIASIFTTIIDSGSGSLVLKGAGTTAITITGANVVTAGSFVWGTGLANFGTITKRKTADESVTSSTTLQDDDHLTFAIAANEEWVADYFLDVGTNLTVTGFKAAITTPSGATLNAILSSIANTSNGALANAISTKTTTPGATLTISAVNSAGNGAFICISVWVLNGATPGSVTFQFAQDTSDVSVLTVFKGSHMSATRVA